MSASDGRPGGRVSEPIDVYKGLPFMKVIDLPRLDSMVR